MIVVENSNFMKLYSMQAPLPILFAAMFLSICVCGENIMNVHCQHCDGRALSLFMFGSTRSWPLPVLGPQALSVLWLGLRHC